MSGLNESKCALRYSVVLEQEETRIGVVITLLFRSVISSKFRITALVSQAQ